MSDTATVTVSTSSGNGSFIVWDHEVEEDSRTPLQELVERVWADHDPTDEENDLSRTVVR